MPPQIKTNSPLMRHIQCVRRLIWTTYEASREGIGRAVRTAVARYMTSSRYMHEEELRTHHTRHSQ